jgi:hypothetical protein
MEPWLLGLMMSLIPYTVQRMHTKRDRQFVIRAVAWKLTIRRTQRDCYWSLSIPLIEQFHR